jgi:hypothetical protein
MRANVFPILELVKERVGNSKKKCRKLEPGSNEQSGLAGAVEWSAMHDRAEVQVVNVLL